MVVPLCVRCHQINFVASRSPVSSCKTAFAPEARTGRYVCYSKRSLIDVAGDAVQDNSVQVSF